ncbi:hypothetical protein BT96DRAFT_932329 [Gymnopus androsaceus JB14]|uniref:Uncharacterized protein n=1 Tax=Gymnopus androsaceus JB14 TaxID=1447944 RepID=A0A6A4IH71_9AGAR|nr:hypothetical protein BT96DRAFT_932329 [Gymnopus androsaceus JB14]
MFVKTLGLNTTYLSNPITAIQLVRGLDRLDFNNMPAYLVQQFQDLAILQEFNTLRQTVNMDKVYLQYPDADLNPINVSTTEQIHWGLPYNWYRLIHPPTPSRSPLNSGDNGQLLVDQAPDQVRATLNLMSMQEQRELLEEILTDERRVVSNNPGHLGQRQSLADSTQSVNSNPFVVGNTPLRQPWNQDREAPITSVNANLRARLNQPRELPLADLAKLSDAEANAYDPNMNSNTPIYNAPRRDDTPMPTLPLGISPHTQVAQQFVPVESPGEAPSQVLLEGMDNVWEEDLLALQAPWVRRDPQVIEDIRVTQELRVHREPQDHQDLQGLLMEEMAMETQED